MSTDPIRQLLARKQIVRYTLPSLPAPEPAAADVATLTPGTGPVRPQQTSSEAFDRFLHDYRSGAYGA